MKRGSGRVEVERFRARSEGGVKHCNREINMSKMCENCKYFSIAYEPFGYEWGRAVCKKYDLITDFKDHRKIKRLTCAIDKMEENT